MENISNFDELLEDLKRMSQHISPADFSMIANELRCSSRSKAMVLQRVKSEWSLVLSNNYLFEQEWISGAGCKVFIDGDDIVMSFDIHFVGVTYNAVSDRVKSNLLQKELGEDGDIIFAFVDDISVELIINNDSVMFFSFIKRFPCEKQAIPIG